MSIITRNLARSERQGSIVGNNPPLAVGTKRNKPLCQSFSGRSACLE
jgi:hypothetical protein